MANLIREGVLDDPMHSDFRNFLYRVHKELRFDPPSPLQYDFAEYLSANVDSEFQEGRQGDREILMAFRGVAKSHTTTCYAIWRLRRDRRHRVLVTSATSRFASLISTFAWQMVSGFDWLSDMKPGPDQRRSAIGFDVGGGPRAQQHESFAAVPITGQLPGRRASIIIGDDLEVPNTADTETARTDLMKRVSELGGAIIVPGGDIYFLGTAQVEDTIYLKLAERGYAIRIYPIQFPHLPDPLAVKGDPRVFTSRYGPRLAPFVLNRLEANPFLAGTAVNPERFPEQEVINRRKEWGTTEFERQFLMLLDAGQGRGNPLKLRDIPVMEIGLPKEGYPLKLPAEVDFSPLPASKITDITVDAMTGDSTLYAPSRVDVWLAPEEVVCHIDTSGEGKDETCWTIGAGLEGRVFVLHQGASTEGHTAETMKAIAKDCKAWGAKQCIVEKNFGGGMFGELLLPHLQDISWPMHIEEVPAGKVQKEKRIIETLEPLITDHRLILSADVLRRDFTVEYEHVEQAKRRFHRLTYQLTRMTKQRGAVVHDDRADSLTGLCQHFIGVLLRQTRKRHQEARLKAVAVEVDEMIDTRRAQGLPTFGADSQNPGLGRPTQRKR